MARSFCKISSQTKPPVVGKSINAPSVPPAEVAAAQIILRWHIQEGFSVIPGSKNPAHIKENISIFDFALTDDEMKQICSLNKEEHFVPMREETLPHFLQLDFSDYDNMEK